MLKKYIFYLLLSLHITSHTILSTCFILKEADQIVLQEGNVSERFSPCSTFKIAISLMAYHENILTNAQIPEFPYKAQYDAWNSGMLDIHQKSHNPTTWMQNSCIWYSQLITQELGIQKFQSYVRAFTYGNQDLSGDKDKNNGLTRAWLSSSLKISPEEQVTFLGKLIKTEFPVSPGAHEQTRNILFIETLPQGWKLYGKTGSGCQLLPNGDRNTDRQIGWFIGWVKKDNRTLIFAQYIQDEQPETVFASKRAKELAKAKLMAYITKKAP